MKKLLSIAASVGVVFAAALSAEGREFTAGTWSGGPLKGDPGGGCLVSRQGDDGITISAYANNNEGFRLEVSNRNWNFPAGAEPSVEMAFDGVQHALGGADVRDPHTLVFSGGGEEEGFQTPFEASKTLTLRVDGKTFAIDLEGSAAASRKLWDCLG